MPMYHWFSESLKEWRPGSIVVFADDVEGARKKALKVFEKNYSETDSYEKEILKQLKLDIQESPDIMDDDVFTICGSA